MVADNTSLTLVHMMYNGAGVATGVAPLVILHELKDKELFSYPQQGYELYPLRCASYELASVSSHVPAVWRTPEATALEVKEDAQTRRNTGGRSLLA